jgi:uncharacterized membrane protein YccC
MRVIASTLPIGKMALKIAVAATISFVIAQALRAEYSFYAVIAAIIVMGSTAGSTLNLGLQRIIGTIIGAITGAIFSVVLGNTFWSLGINVFLAIFLSSVWKLNEAAKLAGYVSAIVILNQSQHPWLYAWNRLLETILGIAVALVVSHTLFPAYAGTELRRCLSQILLELEQLYQLVIKGAFTETYDRATANELKIRIIALFQKNRGLWKEVKQGQAGESPERVVSETWDFLIHRIWEHVLTMEHTLLVRQQDHLWQALASELTKLAEETSSVMIALAMAVKDCSSQKSLLTLETALTDATAQFNQLHAHSLKEASMDELLRFSTFFYTMEEVSRKLIRMANTLK